MIELSKAEIDDLRDLGLLCAEMNAALVIVGAVAYQVHFPDDEIRTGDIDFAIALNLIDFARLQANLLELEWTQVPNREQRWRSKRGAWLDLVPAGKELREAKEFTWPNSEFTMSLEGFDHVFAQARPETVAEDLMFPVIPPVVLMLLKIIAFMDDPARPLKDLVHIRALLSRYEADSDRIFIDAITDAQIEYSLANAFLLGRDLRVLCTDEEVELVRRFIELVGDEDTARWWSFVQSAPRYNDRDEEKAREQLKTFADALLTNAALTQRVSFFAVNSSRRARV